MVGLLGPVAEIDLNISGCRPSQTDNGNVIVLVSNYQRPIVTTHVELKYIQPLLCTNGSATVVICGNIVGPSSRSLM